MDGFGLQTGTSETCFFRPSGTGKTGRGNNRDAPLELAPASCANTLLRVNERQKDTVKKALGKYHQPLRHSCSPVIAADVMKGPQTLLARSQGEQTDGATSRGGRSLIGSS